MKKEVSPAIVVVIVAVVVLIVAGVFWKGSSSEIKAGVPNSGKVVLPPSQVGTKLGGQVLGNEMPASNVPTR